MEIGSDNTREEMRFFISKGGMMKSLISLIQDKLNKLRNAIDPIGYARSLGVKVGKDCRLLGVNFGTEPYLVSIGDHVSMTGTQFITHDGAVWLFRREDPTIDLVSPIKIGNNVFIGTRVIILRGVTIGDNVIIGAASLVTKDIPSNCVAAGVPAIPIKSTDKYFDSIASDTVPTAHLNRIEKRAYLERHFNMYKN